MWQPLNKFISKMPQVKVFLKKIVRETPSSATEDTMLLIRKLRNIQNILKTESSSKNREDKHLPT